jgi:hypothetical protein
MIEGVASQNCPRNAEDNADQGPAAASSPCLGVPPAALCRPSSHIPSRLQAVARLESGTRRSRRVRKPSDANVSSVCSSFISPET